MSRTDYGDVQPLPRHVVSFAQCAVKLLRMSSLRLLDAIPFGKPFGYVVELQELAD
jgi:hypothetical protein